MHSHEKLGSEPIFVPCDSNYFATTSMFVLTQTSQSTKQTALLPGISVKIYLDHIGV
jgi:hypothetical protein